MGHEAQPGGWGPCAETGAGRGQSPCLTRAGQALRSSRAPTHAQSLPCCFGGAGTSLLFPQPTRLLPFPNRFQAPPRSPALPQALGRWGQGGGVGGGRGAGEDATNALSASRLRGSRSCRAVGKGGGWVGAWGPHRAPPSWATMAGAGGGGDSRGAQAVRTKAAGGRTTRGFRLLSGKSRTVSSYTRGFPG